MNEQLEVAVIGGSLVGPSVELMLRAAGFENVTTYEAMSAAVSQSGGVMGLRWSTLDTLKRLGIRGDEVVALRDDRVFAYDVSPDGAGLRERGVSTFPGLVSSWDALHAGLRGLVDVKTGHRLTAIRAERGRWHLRFNRNRTAEADVVVFADGRRSFGREVLDPDRELEYNGYVTWRGLGHLAESVHPEGFVRMYDGARARLFSVTEPVVQSGLNYWELSHNLSASAYAALAGDLPTRRGYLTPEALAGNADAHDVLLRAARGFPEPLLDMIRSSDVSCIPVNDLPLPETVVHRKNEATAVLLGDAIVPVRLQVGAGLNMGLQQASDLVDALARPDRDVALDEWSSRTLARLGPVVELGRSRAHRINLGHYFPVVPGRTAAPAADQWSFPQWVTA